MKQITKQLKQDIQSLESIEERLHHLKDKYKGETVYILTCGPSLGTHDVQKLNLAIFKIIFRWSIKKSSRFTSSNRFIYTGNQSSIY